MSSKEGLLRQEVHFRHLMPHLAGGTVRLAFPVPCFSLFEKHARLVAAGPTGEVIGKPYGHASLQNEKHGTRPNAHWNTVTSPGRNSVQ